MCTATVAQYILDALAARIKNLSVFTAYDVTTDARDITDENVRHTDVRRIVHEEFQTGQFPAEYNMEEFLELVNGRTAICYYPDGKSALDHPLALQPASAPAPVAAPNSVVTSAAPTTHRQGGHTKDGDGYICEATKENRINIPKDLCQKITPNGNSYDITCNGSVLYKTPNKDGRVRIAKAELGGGDKFRVTVDTTANTIVVEQI